MCGCLITALCIHLFSAGIAPPFSTHCPSIEQPPAWIQMDTDVMHSQRQHVYLLPLTCIQKNSLLDPALNFSTKTRPVVHWLTFLNSQSSGKMIRSWKQKPKHRTYKREEREKHWGCSLSQQIIVDQLPTEKNTKASPSLQLWIKTRSPYFLLCGSQTKLRFNVSAFIYK